VLLQPKFVLPEFFMHVQFPADEVLSRPVGAGGAGSSNRGECSVCLFSYSKKFGTTKWA
jgi:hypothetical protein